MENEENNTAKKWRKEGNKPAKKGVSDEATEEAEHEGGAKEVGNSISRGSIAKMHYPS